MTTRAEAPGRVNLIGEHTDYNDGFVLPTAIPQKTRVEIESGAGDVVRVSTTGLSGGSVAASYALGEEAPVRDWRDYVTGVTWLLRREGVKLRGFDVKIVSDVPIGAGLSSSAALLVALLKGLRAEFGFVLDDVQLARHAQTVENEFVGARVGIMDQMACSLADERTALFLDTRDMSYRKIPLPTDVMELFVVDSGVKHSIVNGGYKKRRAECEQAVAVLGVKSLREVERVEDLRLEGVLLRRARHVVSENARVLAAVRALEARDPIALGALFEASHASMRDDYEVSVPEVDALQRLAADDPAVFGARLTGGGFGGSVVGLAQPCKAAAAARRIARAYASTTGRTPTVLVPARAGQRTVSTTEGPTARHR